MSINVPYAQSGWLHRRYKPWSLQVRPHFQVEIRATNRPEQPVSKDWFGKWRQDGPKGWPWRVIKIRDAFETCRPMYQVGEHLWRPSWLQVRSRYVAVRVGPEMTQFAFWSDKETWLQADVEEMEHAWMSSIAASFDDNLVRGQWQQGDPLLLTFI